MKILINRTAILKEILNIEANIKTIRTDPIYLFIKRTLNHLEKRRFGSTMVSIPSPDDPDTILNIRNNSPKFRETISRFRERQAKFEVQMDELYVLKDNLQKRLF